MRKQVDIYCDGACSGNPGPGGWGAILIYKQIEKQMSGFDANTTNNRMELLACIRGLEALNEPCDVDVYTDSAYLYNAFTKGWLANWQRNGWKKADKKPVENIDLWQLLLDLVDINCVKFHKVKGHADNEYNNKADKLATDAIRQHKQRQGEQ